MYTFSTIVLSPCLNINLLNLTLKNIIFLKLLILANSIYNFYLKLLFTCKKKPDSKILAPGLDFLKKKSLKKLLK